MRPTCFSNDVSVIDPTSNIELGQVTAGNNPYGIAVNVVGAGPIIKRPDLVISSLSAPISGIFGGTITSSATVTNQGTESAGAYRLALYLAKDSAIRVGDAIYASCAMSALGPGASQSCSGTVPIPPSLSPGIYFVVAFADDQEAVIESNEGNNTSSKQYALNASGALSGWVLEFYNPSLDNYFITSNPDEQTAVGGGKAGPGWFATGYRFKTGGTSRVCRFYGSLSPGPNSHFYTIDQNECQALIDLQARTPMTQKRWNFESNDFASTAPANGKCPTGLVPVYRAYNNGFSRGIDSNHRITSSQTALQQALALGWSSEGVVMCAPQ